MRILSAPPIAIRAGDTYPAPAAVVEFDTDPTGATAELEVWRRGDDEAALSSVAADVAASAVGSKWQLAVLGDWSSADTEGLIPGQHFARFTLTLTGGEIMTIPPDDRLRVTVHGPAPPIVL